MTENISSAEIQKIIESVVRRQLYDLVRPQERNELINEAWLAVLEAQQT
ncbi:unnamed protein product, partial [marine sediment metagenome]